MPRPRVVLKLGGGLVTEKGQLCIPRPDIISGCAAAIVSLQQAGWSPVIVHGAGGFGHLRAREFRLAEGRQVEVAGQDEAVAQVREDMLRLNAILCQALMHLGLKVSSHPAHIWCTGTGEGFLGAIDRFEVESNIIPITFGDVVDCAPPQDFGILSGDHLVERLAMLAGVRKVIFAISGVDGIMSHPPDASGKGKLLEVWDASLQFDGRHDSSIDVTGGIWLKAACGSRIANRGPEVWVVNGENPQRIVDVVIKGGAIGTQIVT